MEKVVMTGLVECSRGWGSFHLYVYINILSLTELKGANLFDNKSQKVLACSAKPVFLKRRVLD